MINLNDCVEIGLLTKPHGYKGQLILKLHTFSFDEIENMEWAYILIDGLPVPFFISEFSERSADSLIISFEHVKGETEASKLTHKKVFVDKTILPRKFQAALSETSLKTYTVIDSERGPLGIIDALINHPQNPLLRILNKKQEILLPYQEQFIDKIDHHSKEIFVTCPEGLLDL
jgi:16S rRNA processing protein RimM